MRSTTTKLATFARAATALAITAATGLTFAEPAMAAPPSARPSASTSATVDGPESTPDDAAVESARGKHVFFGCCMMYVPKNFKPVNESYDLVLFFHGRPQIVEDTIDEADVNAIVVSINFGIGSGAYSSQYQYPGSFEQLLASVDKNLTKTGLTGLSRNRIALTGWSAGFGAVGAILSKPRWAEQVDAVVLADGFHEMYNPAGEVYRDGLQKYARFAARAMRGDALFAMTHSSIQTVGYASTTKATATLLDMIGLEKGPREGKGPRGMQLVYDAHRAGFHVTGYEGMREPNHIDHFKGLGQSLWPYLGARWGARPSPSNAVAHR
jgi:hypothetical protein